MMEIASFFVLLSMTVLFLPDIFADTDIIMSLTGVDSNDTFPNQKSLHSPNDNNKVDQPSLNVAQKKEVEAFSAILLIKPVGDDSNWEKEFSAIIADNFVDSSFKKIHELKKLIRNSETSHKLVVIPMANAVNSLKPLIHIIQKQDKSSFPVKMTMPKLKGIPKIIKITPHQKSWMEKILPKSNSDKMAMPELKGIPKFIKITPHEKSWKEIIPPKSYTDKMTMPELKGIPKIIKIAPNEKSWKEIMSPKSNIDKMTMSELKGIPKIIWTEATEGNTKIIYDTELNSKKDNLIKKESSNDKENYFNVPLFRKLIKANHSDFTTSPIPIEGFTEKLFATNRKEPTGLTKEAEPEFLQNMEDGQNEVEIQELEKKIDKLLDDIDINNIDINNIEIVTQSSVNNEYREMDNNAYKISSKSSKESSDNISKSGIIRNAVFLRLLPKLNQNKILKPTDESNKVNLNIFRKPSLVSSETSSSKINILNVKDFDGTIKTTGDDITENMTKFISDGKIDDPTLFISNVLEYYPPSFKFNPIHVHREIMKLEELPRIEKIPDKKGFGDFRQPFTFLKSKLLPHILWDEDIHNKIKEASLLGNDFSFEKTYKTVF